MAKFQISRVQGLPLGGHLAPVKPVPDHRMSQAGEMDTDLVSASSFQSGLHQGGVTVAL